MARYYRVSAKSSEGESFIGELCDSDIEADEKAKTLVAIAEEKASGAVAFNVWRLERTFWANKEMDKNG